MKPTWMLAAALTVAGTGPARSQEEPPPQEEEKRGRVQSRLTYAETVIVTASKVEQQLINSPATVSVVTSELIESSPTSNYGDLLRSIPGVNVAQTSARDINIVTRGATSTLSTSQLALLDGRTIYQDFFGFVAWDFLPVDTSEIAQIEVIRGPASAVWGANAMTGVVNVITKTPREIDGTTLTLAYGGVNRDVDGSGQDGGETYNIHLTHAQAVNDRWAYKISAGVFNMEAFARPTGRVPIDPERGHRRRRVPAVSEHRDDAAEARRARRLRLRRRQSKAHLRRRVRRDPGHHPHRNRPFRHPVRDGRELRQGQLRAGKLEGRISSPTFSTEKLRRSSPSEPTASPSPSSSTTRPTTSRRETPPSSGPGTS